MDSSYLLVEFRSIALGYKEVNSIILNYPVELFLVKNICPGSILFIFKGNDHDILGIKNYLKEKNISALPILNIHEGVIGRINSPDKSIKISSLMICEFKNSISAIKASELCLKASGVSIIKIHFQVGLFGKGILILSGLLSSLENSKETILNNFSDKEIVALEIIENPVEELIKCI